jgi:thymidine phosphorylase
VMITDGSQPVGNGIGPVLEARDVMRVLHNDPAAPADLREKSLRLAGRVIEFDPDVRGGEGWRIARDILESGRALTQMQALIDAQGRRTLAPALGELTHEVLAAGTGTVSAIDNLRLARIARLAGAPQVLGAGVDLLHKLGAHVVAGQALYRIHACYPADLGFARDMAARDSGYRLTSFGSADSHCMGR